MRRLSAPGALLACLALPAGAADGLAVRPFAGGGITYGGDTVATVQFTNGDTQDLHAGSLAEVYGGLDVRLAPRASLQASLGYHADVSSGRNGHLLFSRWPIELLGHFHATPQWRFGGGLRYAINPRLTGGGVLNGQGVAFHADPGVVIEGEYLFSGDNSRGVGLKLRAVSEHYKVQDTGESFNGDHVGIFASYYF